MAREKFRRVCIMVQALAVQALLAGCVSDDAMYDRYYTGTGEYTPFENVGVTILRGIYDHLRDFLVCIIVISELMGWFLLLAFSKRNKVVKKTAILVFIIGVPLMVLLIFFGMAFYLNQFY